MVKNRNTEQLRKESCKNAKINNNSRCRCCYLIRAERVVEVACLNANRKEAEEDKVEVEKEEELLVDAHCT